MKGLKRILKRALVVLLALSLGYLALGWITPQSGRFERMNPPGGTVLRVTPLRVYSLVRYGPFRFEMWPEIGIWTPYDESRLTLRPIFPFKRSENQPKVYYVSLINDGSYDWQTNRSLEFTGIVFEKTEHVVTELRELHPQAEQIEIGVSGAIANEDSFSKLAGELGFEIMGSRREGEVSIYLFNRTNEA